MSDFFRGNSTVNTLGDLERLVLFGRVAMAAAACAAAAAYAAACGSGGDNGGALPSRQTVFVYRMPCWVGNECNEPGIARFFMASNPLG